ncbi:MAG: D-aminoacyl-tRNA deacylase [Gemmatimonadales bacterium]|jgi:D-tyrosyl-tRNA(Tyr) deacylase
MRIVAQRVSRASVRVSGETIGSIGAGLLALVAFGAEDGDAELAWMARKLVGLRVFRDDARKMNRSVREVGGSLLVVSQFTLYGDTSRGMRPSFTEAASPERAEELYELFLDALRAQGVPVQSGRFAAMMDVELVNDGPVTLILDR